MQVETCLPSIDAFDCNDPCFLQVESMDQMCDVGEQRPSQEESALTIQEMQLKFAGFARVLAEQRAKSEKADRKHDREIAEQRAKSEAVARELAEQRAKSEKAARKHDREMAEQRAKSEAVARELAEQRAKSEKAARKHDRELAEQRAKSEEADREIAELRAKLEAADREKSEAADRELAEQRAKSEAADRELAEQRATMAEQRERIADLEKQVRPATDRKTFIPGDPQLSVYVLWKSIFNSKLCVTGYPSFFCETFWNLLPLLCLKSKLD